MPTVLMGYGVPCVHTSAYLKALAERLKGKYLSLTDYTARQAERTGKDESTIPWAIQALGDDAFKLARAGCNVVMEQTARNSTSRFKMVQRMQHHADAVNACYFDPKPCEEPPPGSSVYFELLRQGLQDKINEEILAYPPHTAQEFKIVECVALNH